ncbi:MAG: hypothetical protein ACI92Z_003359 [Paracoccaceae bacterium]|jgi:hypothetical protein
MSRISKAIGLGLVALFAISPTLSIAAEQYLDNRSTPQKLIESFYNAINKQQYARAYGYYSDNGSAPKNFQDWADGYSKTKHVSVQFGPTEPNPGAGQIYWALPVVLSVLADNGDTTVFTGCYEIHMVNPGIITLPPHPPMGINDGHFKKTSKSISAAAASLTLLNNC